MTEPTADLNRQFLTTLGNLGIVSHRLGLIRDAARLHRQQLISSSELYAVIEADTPAVLPVSAGQADRAAVLEEAGASLDAHLEGFFREYPEERQNSPWVNGWKDATAELRRMAAVPAGSAVAGHTSGETGGDDPTESVIYEVVGDWGVDSADSAAGARAAVAKWLRAYPKCGAHAQQRIVRDWPDGSEFYGPWTDLPDEPAAGQSAGGTHSCGNCEGIDPDTCLTNPDRTPAPEVVHGCPPDGSGLTPCCGRTPFELPRTDRMSTSPDAVTCTGTAGGAPQPKEARP
jgi:hypothetical protein